MEAAGFDKYNGTFTQASITLTEKCIQNPDEKYLRNRVRHFKYIGTVRCII
jgi:hypothetical protein